MTCINVSSLRANLRDVIRRVRRGERFAVLYRGRPVFHIVPYDEPMLAAGPLEDEPLYRAHAVGRSTDGRSAADHDAVLCGR